MQLLLLPFPTPPSLGPSHAALTKVRVMPKCRGGGSEGLTAPVPRGVSPPASEQLGAGGESPTCGSHYWPRVLLFVADTFLTHVASHFCIHSWLRGPAGPGPDPEGLQHELPAHVSAGEPTAAGGGRGAGSPGSNDVRLPSTLPRHRA